MHRGLAYALAVALALTSLRLALVGSEMLLPL